MKPREQEDHWDFIRQYLQRRPGFHLARLERLAGVKTGTMNQMLRTERILEPGTALLLARVLQQFGLLAEKMPDTARLPPRDVLVPDMLRWIDTHRVIQIAWLEKMTGMSNTQLSRAIRTGVLPEKYDSKLLSVLLLYGYPIPAPAEV